MSQHKRKILNTVGQPPGTLIHVGEEKPGQVKITVIDYDSLSFNEQDIQSVEECFVYRDSPTVTWVNVDELKDVELIAKLNEHFGIHALVQEDILDTNQRPKMEDYGDYVYIVCKMLYLNGKGDGIITEQVSLILGANYVISFQEQEGDVFNVIRDRLRQNKGRVRKMGADYLAYCLLDAIVDYYFVILEKLDDQIEALEDELMEEATPHLPHRLHRLKRDVIFLRKQIWPMRELTSGLRRLETRLIKKQTGLFLNDVYDHTIQIIDTIESFRDILSGLHDIYLSSISNRMNEIMKVLTIFSAIFIPLTFISGIYGMNFEHMPELSWPHGYYSVLAFMGAVALSLILYFKRKKWL